MSGVAGAAQTQGNHGGDRLGEAAPFGIGTRSKKGGRVGHS